MGGIAGKMLFGKGGGGLGGLLPSGFLDMDMPDFSKGIVPSAPSSSISAASGGGSGGKSGLLPTVSGLMGGGGGSSSGGYSYKNPQWSSAGDEGGPQPWDAGAEGYTPISVAQAGPDLRPSSYTKLEN